MTSNPLKTANGRRFRAVLRSATIAMAMVLISAPMAVDANAADDERRVLKARQFETTADPSSEYARLAEEKRMESIRRLKELLAGGVKGETKAEMMLRLADLYFQQGRYLLLKEMAAFDVEYDKCFNDENCQTLNMQPDIAGSRDWQNKSIKLYEAILQNYPRYGRADQATFFLGSALADTEREDDAANAFKKLVKLYPESSYVPDAYVLIGENYFDNDNAYGALRAYLKATGYKDHPKYSFAMYKLAWCYYNVGDYGKGIETMKAVVTYSMNNQDASNHIQLQDEALKDLVRFFADAGAMNEAYEYFTKLGKKDLIRSMLQRLASMYFEQGKFDQAVDTFRRLILEDPSSKDNPEYQTEIISAYRKIGQKERTLEEIDRLLRDYGKNSAWARANASDPNTVKDAELKIEKELHRVAVDYHNAAKQLEKGRHGDAAKVYDLARQAYATYLGEFSTSPRVYDVRYQYGELLYKIKDYEGAFAQYMQVVEIDPKGKHSRFCAESAIFAAEEKVKMEGGGDASGKQTADASKKKEAIPLTEWEQKLVDACNKYATLYPNDGKVRNIIYKSAYLLYNKYQFENAAEQFKVVIQMDPSSKEAEQAANLILDSFVVRENWQSLKDNSKFYYDQERLGSAKFKKETYEIYERSSFKVIEVNFEKDKDYGKAADGFVAFYEEFPEAKTAAQALNNASIYFYEVDRVDDSVKIRHILIEDPAFGASERSKKYYYNQVAALGYDYELIADYGKASFYYEKLWGLYPEEMKEKKDDAEAAGGIEKKAGDAIYSAAVFQHGLGNWQQAIDNYNAFAAAFPKDERLADIKLTVAKIYEEQEMWSEAANVFHDFYIQPPPGSSLEYEYFARLHYTQALEKMSKGKELLATQKETVDLYNKYIAGGGVVGSHTEFVAEMMYKLATPELDGYMALELKGKGKSSGNEKKSRKAEDEALTTSLGAKTKALMGVQKTFTGVVAVGAGEWGLAALVALGRAYEDMGDTLRNGDMPYYLTEEQREIYGMAIEDKVYVQEEKAVEAYRLALEKSYELTLYNENTAFATRRLGELRPDDFPGLQEQLLDARYTSNTSRQFDFESSL